MSFRSLLFGFAELFNLLNLPLLIALPPAAELLAPDSERRPPFGSPIRI